jgi:truncated hemoglobin YjbI
MFQMVKAALSEVTLTPEQTSAVMGALARPARELTM